MPDNIRLGDNEKIVPANLMNFGTVHYGKLILKLLMGVRLTNFFT